MRWLALDVGSRRVGVAVCNEGESLATVLPAFPYAGPEGTLAVVAALVRTWEAGGVVVGVPTTRAGASRGERRVSAVLERLHDHLAVTVETVDERGTTKAAEQLLAQAEVPRRRWPQLVDSLAAKLILESHLAARDRDGGRPRI
jgi:putative Holliday junction resolvase